MQVTESAGDLTCVQKYEGCLRRAKLTDNTIMLWNDGCAIALCHGWTMSAQHSVKRVFCCLKCGPCG